MKWHAAYPIWVSVAVVLSAFASNQSLLKLSDLWRPLGVAIGGSMALWLLASLLFRDLERGAAAAAVLCVSLLNSLIFSRYMPVIGEDPQLWLWAGLTVLFAGLAGWKWKWHRPTAVFAALLALIPAFRVAFFEVRRPKPQAEVSHLQRTANLPDIIYIVLDGYGRTDVFERLYGFSDRDFISGLRERGFYIADKSVANYSQTELSLSSSLNFDYIQNLGEIKLGGDKRPYLQDKLHNNRLFSTAAKHGYTVRAFGSGFPPLEFESSKERDESLRQVSLFETHLIDRTVISRFVPVDASMHVARRRWIKGAFGQIANYRQDAVGPVLAFAHIVAPHPPFSFGPNGEEIKPRGAFGFWDGSDFLAHVGSAEDYKRGYAGQATYIGKQVLSAVDSILRASKSKPIIVIQGDHGPKAALDQISIEKTDLSECFPILNAYLVPDSIRHDLHPETTPVNSFRIILGELLGEDLPELPDRSWYSPYSSALEFTEVTGQIDAVK